MLLIDEIDKADIEFPNDLLLELDRMEFFVYETGETIKAARRPVILITSNNEKELPDAFLRRCFFHYIKFPERETMQKIVDVHFPDIKQKLVSEALNVFYQIRDVPGLKKKPSTSELLDWLKLLLNEDIPPEALKERDPTKLIPPLHGALLKNEQDVHLVRASAFLRGGKSRQRLGRRMCAAVKYFNARAQRYRGGRRHMNLVERAAIVCVLSVSSSLKNFFLFELCFGKCP